MPSIEYTIVIYTMKTVIIIDPKGIDSEEGM